MVWLLVQSVLSPFPSCLPVLPWLQSEGGVRRLSRIKCRWGLCANQPRQTALMLSSIFFLSFFFLPLKCPTFEAISLFVVAGTCSGTDCCSVASPCRRQTHALVSFTFSPPPPPNLFSPNSSVLKEKKK